MSMEKRVKNEKSREPKFEPKNNDKIRSELLP
jgi:hypothetical protein